MLLDNTEKINELLRAVKVIQEELSSHHEAAGVPLTLAIPIAAALVSVIGALWVWGKIQQNRGDGAYKDIDAARKETIELLSGRIMTLVTTLQESNNIYEVIAEAIKGQKEALYKLRDNQGVMKEKFTADLTEIDRSLETIGRKLDEALK